MTGILLVAFVGLVVGFFLLFGISPMEFTDGLFAKLMEQPNSIKAQINEATQRKKPNVLRREIMEAQEILRLTNRSFELIRTGIARGFLSIISSQTRRFFAGRLSPFKKNQRNMRRNLPERRAQFLCG